MTFVATIPTNGLAGWSFLQRTADAQKNVLEGSPQFAREADYFREKIGSITTAEDLVSDRVLLRLSLSAFGLQDDINNRFFVQTVLSDGILNDDALANRLADQRYREFSLAFGFGPGEIPQTFRTNFVENIIERALNQNFEVAVGEQDADLRLALGFGNDLGKILESGTSETAKWFNILGTPPVRSIFEGALNLPSSIGSIDLDQQLEIFRERSRIVFGTNSIEDLAADEIQEDIVRRYLLQQQIGQVTIASSASNALTLLQA